MRVELIKRPLRWPAALLRRGAMRWGGKRMGIVLVYHRIGPRGEARDDDGVVHTVAVDRFAAHMRHLRRAYRIVPASRILEATCARRRGQRFPLAVTFDDELPEHWEQVRPVLAGMGLPATFFVSGRRLAGEGELWWEVLDRATARGMAQEVAEDLDVAGEGDAPGLSPAQAAAERLLALPAAEREAWRRRLQERLGPAPPHGLTRAQLEDLVAAGFELGFHTLRHEHLPQLDDEALGAALRDGRDELSAMAGRRMTAVAYPFGRADARVARAAAAAGFRFGFTSREEPVAPSSDPLLIGRIEAPDHSAGILALSLARRLTRPSRPAPEGRAPTPAPAPSAADRSPGRERG